MKGWQGHTVPQTGSSAESAVLYFKELNRLFHSRGLIDQIYQRTVNDAFDDKNVVSYYTSFVDLQSAQFNFQEIHALSIILHYDKLSHIVSSEPPRAINLVNKLLRRIPVQYSRISHEILVIIVLLVCDVNLEALKEVDIELLHLTFSRNTHDPWNSARLIEIVTLYAMSGGKQHSLSLSNFSRPLSERLTNITHDPIPAQILFYWTNPAFYTPGTGLNHEAVANIEQALRLFFHDITPSKRMGIMFSRNDELYRIFFCSLILRQILPYKETQADGPMFEMIKALTSVATVLEKTLYEPRQLLDVGGITTLPFLRASWMDVARGIIVNVLIIHSTVVSNFDAYRVQSTPTMHIALAIALRCIDGAMTQGSRSGGEILPADAKLTVYPICHNVFGASLLILTTVSGSTASQSLLTHHSGVFASLLNFLSKSNEQQNTITICFSIAAVFHRFVFFTPHELFGGAYKDAADAADAEKTGDDAGCHEFFGKTTAVSRMFPSFLTLSHSSRDVPPSTSLAVLIDAFGAFLFTAKPEMQRIGLNFLKLCLNKVNLERFEPQILQSILSIIRKGLEDGCIAENERPYLQKVCDHFAAKLPPAPSASPAPPASPAPSAPPASPTPPQ